MMFGSRGNIGAVIVDICVDKEPETRDLERDLDRSGTREKGRLFAVSSNPRAPATLPRTISQDSDVQATVKKSPIRNRLFRKI